MCPEALHGPIAEMAVDGTDGGEDAPGDGEFEEFPQAARRQAEPSDFVREPDAEGVPAAAPSIAVAAKDPASAYGLLGAALVETAQIAVPNQHADLLAVRTRHLLETFGKRDPFLVATVKPWLLAHVRSIPREDRWYSLERKKVRGGGGVR